MLGGFSLLAGVGQSGSHVRQVVALVGATALAGVAARLPALLLPASVVWLTALGLVRRVVTGLGSSSHLDPLLLVGPFGLALAALAALGSGASANPTRLTRVVTLMTLLILIESVNPIQGDIYTGASSLLFVLVPTFGFWIGRVLDARQLARVLRLVALLGAAVGAYGLLQTFSGFPSWDARWIEQSTQISLNVGGVVRPFASFSSAAEYAEYVAVAIVVWLAFAWRAHRFLLAAVALSLLIPALVLESSRGIVVLVLVAAGVMVGAWSRVPLALAAGLGAVMLVVLGIGLHSYASGPAPGTYSVPQSASATLVSHDVAGLKNPFNSSNSTLDAHWHLILLGIRSSLSNPVGRGTGAVTIAGATFGGTRFGTEADPSNAAVAFGLPGLVLYLALALLAIRTVYETARRRRDAVSIAALGVVVVTALQWMNGGLYSVAFLPWLVFGWCDGEASRHR